MDVCDKIMRSPQPLSHAGFVSFDKHDLLSVNTDGPATFCLFYKNICLRGATHYSDESHV